MSDPEHAFVAAVRTIFGAFTPASKIEASRRELIRGGIFPRDETQAPYEASPPRSPLH
jgi:hypothetical protein